ncbi:MAG: hypothetical protein A2156_05030 [Deltaproteobacteria bacterium RBG_16_48_10]|nr:MAG: hypothetical protein A2156_05030 [Deltaproteobacteria bacterium RBG_16_48_10]
MKKGKMISMFLSSILMVSLISAAGFSAVGAAEKGPIKIGFIAPRTGNFAQLGIEMIEGAKLLLEENNYSVAGRKIEFIVEDEGAGPDTAVTKARKLIKHDVVHLVAGVFMASAGYAVAPVCIEAQVPLFITEAGSDDLTQRRASRLVSRLSVNGGDVGHAAGEYAYKELGWRKAITIGLDYAWGYEAGGGFHRVFEDLGGKVIQKLWPPVNTMDFSPYVTNMERETDGIWNVVSGAATIRLMKTLRDSGILKKTGLLCGGTTVDESMLPALADDALGVVSIWNYSGALDTPKNKRFRELCKKKLNKDATWSIQQSWVGLEWILQAMKEINGEVENKEKFSNALREVKLDSLRGLLKMDSYGHPIQDYFVRRVDRVKDGWGGFQNTVIKTIPAVNQFWTWDAKTYLSQPGYNRDNPPCKYCK